MKKAFITVFGVGVFFLMSQTSTSFAQSLKIEQLEQMKISQKDWVGKWHCVAHNPEEDASFEFIDDIRADGMVYSSGSILIENTKESLHATVEMESQWRFRDATHVQYDAIKTLKLETNDPDFKRNLEELYAERTSSVDEILKLNTTERVVREIDEDYPNMPIVQCTKITA